MAKTVARTLRRIGLGSLSGIGLYIIVLLASTIVLAIGNFTSQFTIGDTWAWYTIGNNDWAWFTIGTPRYWETELSATYNTISNILTIIIALATAIWALLYVTKSEEIDTGTVLKIVAMAVLVIIIIRIVFGTI